MSDTRQSHEPAAGGITNELVILVGVGGATCSGKTTLAKQLRKILPDSIIVHQDDFAPPVDTLPMHPVYNIADWDDPEGAIDWPRFAAFLQQVKRTGVIPANHNSHDHMNIQKEVSFDTASIQSWKERFQVLQRERAVRVRWVLVDGFLLYWQKASVDALDIRFLLRVPRDVLLQRRIDRGSYFTADMSTAQEGEMWVDPPYYFDGIVYPAYVKAFGHLFENGDVESGNLKPDTTVTSAAGRSSDGTHPESQTTGAPVPGLVLMDALKMSADDLLDWACRELVELFERRAPAPGF
ncbi:P-loop containing nucleoside triphosphate hydrolase protein [Auriculariales sp. MPI-PUGE-AT-0066]|nr:P-loop containing nucleoside triphosphate hydrolase protein [Auriculariales sp. MPI-PUGE-AT-0066]